tara:strand:+ start:281 stop:691 length:411 start_codon:yes stop_codon:yes gene_type:complete
MTKDKALKLALEALQTWAVMQPNTTACAIRIPAIAAIQKVLAQEPWTPEDTAHRPGGLAQADWTTLTDADRKSYQLGHNAGVKHQKQVTKRQPLTDAEIMQIELGLRQYNSRDTYDLSLNEFARAIEAKLKEKNNG